MKNPLSNETVKSAAIVIGSAVAFIAISKGVTVLRKKFGGNPKVKAIFDSADTCERGDKFKDAVDACRGKRNYDWLGECTAEASRCERAG